MCTCCMMKYNWRCEIGDVMSVIYGSVECLAVIEEVRSIWLKRWWWSSLPEFNKVSITYETYIVSDG